MLQTLSGAETRALKAQAQRLDPVVKLGRAGVSDALLASLDEALTRHSLVKMKFTDFKDEKRTIVPLLAEKLGCAVIAQVGHVAVFYRAKAS